MGFSNHYKLPHYVTFQAILQVFENAKRFRESKENNKHNRKDRVIRCAGFLDEEGKKGNAQKLKAIIPGLFSLICCKKGSAPMAKGWGTGGLELTLSLINESDTLKAEADKCECD